MSDVPANVVLSAACFPANANIETIIERATAYGGVELVLREGVGALRFKTSGSELARLREAASALPGGVVNVHLEFPGGVHFAHADGETRANAGEMLATALRKASALGATSISVVPAVIGPWPDGDYDEALHVVCEAMREAARTAERAGVAIGIVPASGGFLLSPVETRQLIDEVNSPHVGVVLEVEALECVGVLEQWVKALGRRVIAVRGEVRELQFEGVWIETGKSIEA